MILSLYRFLCGSVRLRFVSHHPEKYLDLALSRNIPIFRIERRENEVSFSLLPWHEKIYRTFLTAEEKEKVERKSEGILILIHRFGKRWGLFLGLFLFFFLSFLSTRLVWSVEVVGNSFVEEKFICDKMKELGLSPGVFISSVDTEDFSLSFQIKNPEFSFASLNVIGTRAILTVREREKVEKKEEGENSPSNLVSSISGEILNFQIFNGTAAVKRGETVKKGALLVSGVVENKNGTFRTVAAKGRVFAKTERYFEVTVPFAEKINLFTGREEVKKRFHLLSFSFSEPLYDACDFELFTVSEKTERLTLLGRNLPILVESRTFYETEEKNKVLTVDRAKDLAYDKYEEYKRETLLPDYEILEEKVDLTQTEEGITLSVELVLSEDIAFSVPFSCVEEKIP